MKKMFGLVAFVLFAVLVLAPAASQAGTPPNDNGDHLMLRDQDRDQTCQLDLPDLDRLQSRDRDRDRDRDCQTLPTTNPLLGENDGNVYRHRIQERAQHSWYLVPSLGIVLIWPGRI